MWKKWIKYCLLLALVVFSPKALSVGDSSEFSYNGRVQTYTVPEDGWYQLEVWGAQGSGGGYGGYSVGYKELKKGTVLYIVCGGAGSKGSNTSAGGYNGGGNGYSGDTWGGSFGGGGGGATHIALVTGQLSEIGKTSFDAKGLIVAGGGGGGYYGGGGARTGVRTGGGGSGWIGGVTSWNGKSASMSNGQQSGNGRAKITIMSVAVTLTCPTASDHTYDSTKKIGMTCPAGSTASGTCSATNADSYTCTCTANYGYKFNNPCSRTWSIAKASLTIPSLSDKTKTYNSHAQSPTINNRDEDTVSQSGTVSAIDAGTYTVTWKLIDPTNYKWKDDTGEAKSETWTIARAKTAKASKADKIYNQSEQTGVSGNYVTWTGTTKATNPGTYKATATPDKNHAWSDGTTNSKDFTWYIFQNWKRYTVRCVTDSLNKPVLPTDTIEGSYTIQEIIFDIKAQDTSSYTFCVGYTPVKTDVNYNGYKAGVYYWENGGWVKK